MKRSDKILRKYNLLAAEPTLEYKVAKIEALLEHLVNNEIPHIWAILKAIGGAILAIMSGIVVAVIKIVFGGL